MAFLVSGDIDAVRRALALVALPLFVLLLAGCGVPHELSKQAEEVESVAAEASLLAHDAGEDSTTATFTREHAKALRKLLRQVEPAIENPGLSRIAQQVDRSLAELADDPGDEKRAQQLEQDLDKASKAAGELAG